MLLVVNQHRNGTSLEIGQRLESAYEFSRLLGVPIVSIGTPPDEIPFPKFQGVGDYRW